MSFEPSLVLRALGGVSPDLIYALDPSGRYTFVSDAGARILGLTAEMMIGRTWPEVGLPPEREAEFAEERARVLRTRRSESREVTFAMPDGEHVFDFVIHPLVDGDGEARGVLVVSRDITERRALSRRVQREEERYRMLVDATSDVVWSTDPSGKATSQETKWLDLTGQTIEDVRNGRWTDVVHPADVDRVRGEWGRALEGESAYAIEYRVRVRDGSYRWFLVRGVPLRDDDGKVREWIGTATDIDDRKRATEAASFLADASALLSSSLDPETILQRLATMAVPRLADWCAIDVARENAPYERLVVAHEDPLKRDVAMQIDRDYRMPPEQDVIAQVMQTGKTQMVDGIPPEQISASARDERHRSLLQALGLRSFICAPIYAGEAIFGTLTVVSAESGRRFTDGDRLLVEDVATRAGAAVENAQLYVAAQQASRAKDDFLATLSHELRTPMTSILGWARLLTLGSPDPELLENGLAAIERSANAQAQLIDDLLDVSRISAGKLSLIIENVDVNQIVRTALEAVRPAATARRVHVDVSTTGVARVSGDANRLQQIVWNLLSNAVKFTPAGGQVKVRTEAGEDAVTIRVSDTGVGIAPEAMPFIFDRFRQADSSTTRRFGGLGLGLSIVKQLTELHGGSVTAESREAGQGATFTVSLPVGSAPDRTGVPFTSSLAPLNGIATLVVDDDADTRQYVAAVLESAGARVRLVSSAAEALAAIGNSIPDLLLSDIAMPDRDGYSLIEEVRRALRISEERLPAVAMTALGRDEDRVRILAAGFQRALMKPIDPAELTRTVAEMLQLR